MLPAKKDIAAEVKKDNEKLEKYLTGTVIRIDKAYDAKNYIEAFLLSWGLVEQLLVPSLIRMVAHKLSFKELPSLSGMQMSQLIKTYYLLSHDLKLYKSLTSVNAKRNRFIHGIAEGDLAAIDKKAKKLTKEILGENILPILETLRGNLPVPVLTLYQQGWNDMRTEALRIIRSKY